MDEIKFEKFESKSLYHRWLLLKEDFLCWISELLVSKKNEKARSFIRDFLYDRESIRHVKIQTVMNVTVWFDGDLNEVEEVYKKFRQLTEQEEVADFHLDLRSNRIPD